MKIPHNQELGHTWLILAPYSYHSPFPAYIRMSWSDKANNVVVCFNKE